jgi:hypothetical protein
MFQRALLHAQQDALTQYKDSYEMLKLIIFRNPVQRSHVIDEGVATEWLHWSGFWIHLIKEYILFSRLRLPLVT